MPELDASSILKDIKLPPERYHYPVPSLEPSPIAIEKHENKAKQARKNRQKGKRGEAAVGKIFSDWWGTEESFLHSQSSGAGNRFGAAGDITTPLNFPFVIENKNSEAWTLGNILTHWKSRVNKPKPGKKQKEIQPNTFWGYWEQVLEATKDYNKKAINNKRIQKYPMLIFTKNYEEIFIMIHMDAQLEHKINLPANHMFLTNEQHLYYIFI
jgi:hypothetical protein